MYYYQEHTVFMNKTQAKNIITILNFAQFSGKGRHAFHTMKILECEFSCANYMCLR